MIDKNRPMWSINLNHITQEMFDKVAEERIPLDNKEEAQRNISETGDHLSNLCEHSIITVKIVLAAVTHLLSEDIRRDDLLHSVLVTGIRLGYTLGNVYPDKGNEK